MRAKARKWCAKADAKKGDKAGWQGTKESNSEFYGNATAHESNRNFHTARAKKKARKPLISGANVNVTTLVRDDEVAGELGSGVLHHEFELRFA